MACGMNGWKGLLAVALVLVAMPAARGMEVLVLDDLYSLNADEWLDFLADVLTDHDVTFLPNINSNGTICSATTRTTCATTTW